MLGEESCGLSKVRTTYSSQARAQSFYPHFLYHLHTGNCDIKSHTRLLLSWVAWFTYAPEQHGEHLLEAQIKPLLERVWRFPFCCQAIACERPIFKSEQVLALKNLVLLFKDSAFLKIDNVVAVHERAERGHVGRLARFSITPCRLSQR